MAVRKMHHRIMKNNVFPEICYILRKIRLVHVIGHRSFSNVNFRIYRLHVESHVLFDKFIFESKFRIHGADDLICVFIAVIIETSGLRRIADVSEMT